MFVETNMLNPEVVGTFTAISSQTVRDISHQRNGPLQESPLVDDNSFSVSWLGPRFHLFSVITEVGVPLGSAESKPPLRLVGGVLDLPPTCWSLHLQFWAADLPSPVLIAT